MGGKFARWVEKWVRFWVAVGGGSWLAVDPGWRWILVGRWWMLGVVGDEVDGAVQGGGDALDDVEAWAVVLLLYVYDGRFG